MTCPAHFHRFVRLFTNRYGAVWSTSRRQFGSDLLICICFFRLRQSCPGGWRRSADRGLSQRPIPLEKFVVSFEWQIGAHLGRRSTDRPLAGPGRRVVNGRDGTKISKAAG